MDFNGTQAVEVSGAGVPGALVSGELTIETWLNLDSTGTVKTILENGLDQQALNESGFDKLGHAYTGRGRFSRDTKKLLTH